MQRLLLLLAAVLAGCAAPRLQLPAGDSRALIASYIPASVPDREGWAADIFTPMAVLEIPVTAENVCAIVAITEQESGFRADPVIPNLPAIARSEIERRRERLGIPELVLDAALALKSSNGRTYRERLDHAKTERELSDIYEDLIGRVPLGRTFLENGNPVRTGGPMQVSVAFARTQAEDKSYPYPIVESIRDEVFTRRGGMYFGIAHLLDYPASYDRPIYRFADFNAGRYASRNAAIQSALSLLTRRKLALDGDLTPAEKARDGKAGATESAALNWRRGSTWSTGNPARSRPGGPPRARIGPAVREGLRAGRRPQRQAGAARGAAGDRAPHAEDHAKAHDALVRRAGGGEAAAMLVERPHPHFGIQRRAFIFLRRSAITFMICSAKCGACCTMKRKRFSGMTASLQGVFAMAVAVRGAWSIRAISPKGSPGPRTSSTFESIVISTSPSSTTYISKPMS